MSAEIIPIRRDPMKMTVNYTIANASSYPIVLSGSVPRFLTVSYITIPIASLKIDSPNTIAYKLTSASSSLKMAKTDTGSVAEIKEPNAQESLKVKGNDQPNYPVAQNIMLENRMAMNVPTNEYISTLPKFLKKGPFCMLYPDSKMIGGSSNSINSNIDILSLIHI